VVLESPNALVHLQRAGLPCAKMAALRGAVQPRSLTRVALTGATYVRRRRDLWSARGASWLAHSCGATGSLRSDGPAHVGRGLHSVTAHVASGETMLLLRGGLLARPAPGEHGPRVRRLPLRGPAHRAHAPRGAEQSL
jgi:hypothetical protein